MSSTAAFSSRLHFSLMILVAVLSATGVNPADAATCDGHRIMHADVVAFDQPMMINRLGTNRPEGMIYALRGDVKPIDPAQGLVAGNVQLRSDKRPRPLVLRVNVGDCLKIDFQNLLAAQPTSPQQPVTRTASIHVTGLEPAIGITDDGFDAGANANGQVASGGSTTYTLYAPAEGTYLMYSPAGDFNGFATTQQMAGLFGAVNVEPKGAEWYRSQVSNAVLKQATTGYENGQPKINYDVLRMTKGDEIVASDLTALITGKNHGRFDKGSRPTPNPSLLPDREAPFREITSIYSESLDLVQAFPDYYTTPGTNLVVSGGGDGFAINYGASGIVNEILANRLKIGPSADCPECKFEEFFLSSWPGGDPGIVVDIPANLNCTDNWLSNIATSTTSIPNGTVTASKWGTTGCRNADTPRRKPTLAFYPDDPSNVYHAYLGDHTIFRVLHAGASVHHVHHHHAHQWLFAPEQPGSSYLDSQAIGPGSNFSMELVYAGAGNQNLTAGDTIFHCHFYPHFASGMWALFRVHDTLELGTVLGADGRPAPGSRALPDPEIMTGTPTPAVVPLPTYAQAPVPAAVEIANGQVHFAQTPTSNPGYPFFVPGLAGHRAPHPPLAFANDQGQSLDGGLPRHLIVGGHVATEVHSQTDYTKNLDGINAIKLPEEGTLVEQLAMKAHEQREHPGITPEGTPAKFIETGAPRASGAPFANPTPIEIIQTKAPRRLYKGADVQIDTVFNKAGWHYPQQRMMALWSDIKSLIDGSKPPEPLFVRANNGETVEYWQTNLVPSYYELDDYQVRTPTDIIGQHIHLVKFDVLAADGAANGFNYEDGTFSPQEVRDRIAAITKSGGLCAPAGFVDVPPTCPAGTPVQQPKPKSIAALGDGPTSNSKEWVGAQATVRLWYVDPLKDLPRERSYMTVFTHDHFSPSTHQETGLYGGVLIEPTGSTWTKPDGTPLGQGRDDGGPTSYAANILPPTAGPEKSYREFALAWADTQLVYGNMSRSQPDCYPTPPSAPGCAPAPASGYAGWTDNANATNPATNANGVQPLIIADFGSGTFSMNYRNEPLPLRLNGAALNAPKAGDAAWAYASIPGRNAQFAMQPAGGTRINPFCATGSCFIFPKTPVSGGMKNEDPYTPLLRAYPQDPVQIRLLSGGFTTMHDVITHGLPWKFEPYNPNSGWRESQLALLSEHFELHVTPPRSGDYLYGTSASYEGMSNGLWGLLRTYDTQQADLKPLPSNPTVSAGPQFTPPQVSQQCGNGAACLRKFGVTALTIAQALGSGAALTYNGRGLTLASGFATGEVLNDPQAIIYVRNEDLCQPGSSDCVTGGMLKQTVKVEPLVLRVAAGDVVEVTLTNAVDPNASTFTTFIPGGRPSVPYTNPYGKINLLPSRHVGLHPQLLALDVASGNGVNLGNNQDSTVAPGTNRIYTWYAGTIEAGSDGKPKATPVEFGALNLMPSDPLNHAYRGLFGGLVVEPAGSTFAEDPDSHMSATVSPKDGAPFRDFVLIGQDDADILLNGLSNYTAGNALSAVNYRTEPAIYRYGQLLTTFPGALSASVANWSNLASADLSTLGGVNWANVDTSQYIANNLIGGEPQTPIFSAPAGMPVRFRLLHAGGNGDNQQVFELSGHVWQAEPYINNSTAIGDNKTSPFVGVTSGYGVTSHFDVVIASAGGAGKVPGDYVYRTWTADQFQVGFWGLFRVTPALGPGPLPDVVAVGGVSKPGNDGKVTVYGHVTVPPAPGALVYAPTVDLKVDGKTMTVTVGRDGRWSATLDVAPGHIEVTSKNGGVATYQGPGAAKPRLGATALVRTQPGILAAPAPVPPRTRIFNRRHVGLLQ